MLQNYHTNREQFNLFKTSLINRKYITFIIIIKIKLILQ